MSSQPEGCWPSNFAPAEPSLPLPPLDFGKCVQALDGFGVGYFGWPLDNLWSVVLDGDGHLRAVSFSEKRRLPDSLQVQLSAHVIKASPRALEAAEVYLFALEYVENLADTPGFNDPVSLYGRMHGPFSLFHNRPLQPRVCAGRFCASRADVLEGLVRGEPFVFHSAGAAARGEWSNSIHHLMLPTGLPDAPGSPAKVVLAYPLPIEARETSDNASLAAALAYDVLSRLQDDLRRAEVCGAFPKLILPVPSRRGLEARLRAKGYEIRGDYAYAPTAKPAKSWLGRLFEGFTRKRTDLPPEATLAEFLRIARSALETLRDWPSAQAKALRNQCHVLGAAWPPEEGKSALSRILNADRIEEKKGELHLYCNGDKGGNAVFLLPPEFYRRDGRNDSALDIDVEWFDDAGGGQICFVPAWQENYKIHATFILSGSKTWKTASFHIPNARADGKLWHGDVGIYFHHAGKQPLRIRRVKIRANRPDYLHSGKLSCNGGLDHLGGLDLKQQIAECKLGNVDSLHISGWMVNLRDATAQGHITFILESEEGYWPVAVTNRHDRPDIVMQFGGAYATAGYSGDIPLKSLVGYVQGQPVQGLRPGTYRLIMRLHHGDTYVQREQWHRLRLVGAPQQKTVPAPRPKASPPRAAKAKHSRVPKAKPVRERRKNAPAESKAAPKTFASGVTPKAASGSPLQVVYYDSGYPCVWLKNPQHIADFLAKDGFAALNAPELSAWMRTRLENGALGSVCVFAQDIAPDTVLESQSKDCLLRRYLDAGGRVVWPGDVPFYYKGGPAKNRETWGTAGQAAVLGLPSVWSDLGRLLASVTPAGKEMGVTVLGHAKRCQSVSDVTTALSTVKNDYAESWFINYCAAAPHSGFYRLYAGSYPGSDNEANAMLVRVARYKLTV